MIGQEKDRKGDEARRAKLHQQWLEQQDAQQVAQLMEGVKNGFRRKRAGDLLDEDVSPPENSQAILNLLNHFACSRHGKCMSRIPASMLLDSPSRSTWSRLANLYFFHVILIHVQLALMPVFNQFW